MKKILPIIFLLVANSVLSQTVSIRIVQTNYSSIDPDGAGPATGSVTIQFELTTSSGTILGDGLGLSFVYQSALLMPTPTNTTTALGPVTSAGWSQQVDNRLGNSANVTYGSKTFDKRMIITFNQSSGLDNASFPNAWTAVAQVTYWTLGTSTPEGGYATPEDGITVPQNSLSSDGGLTSYNYLSPNLNTPIPLGSTGALPVVFTKFDAHCTNSGSVISWATESESNANYYELERSTDGNNWTPVARINASGTTSTVHTYQQTDAFSGTGLYKIKQVDLDGHFTYTSIISSNCEFNNMGVVLYPVPARDLLNVIIQSDKALKTKLYIIDVAGKVVQKMDINLAKGNNTFPINLKGLASGEYILNSSTPGMQLNKKFNVVR